MRSLIVLLLFVFISVNAQDGDLSYMKAIDSCVIAVEDLTQPARNLGITENVIKVEVLNMFNGVGIKSVVSDAPTFYIVLGSFYTDSKRVVYNINVELYDFITYKNDYIVATIWTKNYTGIIGSKVDKSAILDNPNTLLDLFKADYIVGRN